MRLDKLLSQLKFGSRKDIKAFLKLHEVTIDQKRVLIPSIEVDPSSQVIRIDQEALFYKEQIHLAIYKPKGYLSANQDALYPCVVELIQSPYHRFDFKIAGRLDLDAEGLMVLTTNGQFVHEITHPKSHVPKTYEVILDKPFQHHQQLIDGVVVKDGHQETYTAKAIEITSMDTVVTIVIDEGKFHQVKRMFQSVGYDVVNLKRMKIGQLDLGNLTPGEYKEIRREDLYD